MGRAGWACEVVFFPGPSSEKRRPLSLSPFFLSLSLSLSHLVPEPARPRVDHHDHLPDLVDAHLARGGGIVHLLDHLHLGVVVARAERAHLR